MAYLIDETVIPRKAQKRPTAKPLNSWWQVNIRNTFGKPFPQYFFKIFSPNNTNQSAQAKISEVKDLDL